eukprot:g29576.t1
MLLYDDQGVSLVYGELHAHCDNTAGFAAYEDDACKVQVVHLAIDTNTCVSERVGIDCSCFSLGDHHFSTRTCAEKMLWLRAISNVKVKLRHLAATPTPTELRFYRAAVREQMLCCEGPGLVWGKDFKEPALLPRRRSNLSQLPRAGPVQALPMMSMSSPKPDSGMLNGHGGGVGPNCQSSEPVALLKDPAEGTPAEDNLGDGNDVPPPMEFPKSTRVALGEVGGRQLAPERELGSQRHGHGGNCCLKLPPRKG